MTLLKINQLDVAYGAIRAIQGISLLVEAGEVVTLIGPNGAGKTTLLRTLSGVLRPNSGEISYQDAQGDTLMLHRMAPHKIVASGIAQVPEGRLIFQNLTVKENLELGGYSRRDRRAMEEDWEKVLGLFPKLKDRLKQNAGTLSGGEQQMLAIGRALMAKPRLLLLDEPSLGLAPALVQQIFKTLAEINQQGTALLLVEQDAFLALELAQRAYVMEAGRIKLQGPAKELLNNPEVQKAYLGG